MEQNESKVEDLPTHKVEISDNIWERRLETKAVERVSQIRRKLEWEVAVELKIQTG